MKDCFRCGKKFSRFDSLKRHLAKLNACDIIYLNVPRDELTNNYKKYKNDYTNMIKYKDKNIICEYCGKTYTHINSYYYHIKNACKNANIHKKLKEQKIINVQNKIDKVSTLIKNISNDEEQLFIDKMLKELDEDLENITTKSDNNSTKFYINSFGKENIDHINDKQWEDILINSNPIVSVLFDNIYVLIKENWNIYFSKTSDKYCMIYEKDEWIWIMYDTLLDKIIDNIINIIDKQLKKNLHKFDNVTKEQYLNKNHGIICHSKTHRWYYKKISYMYIKNRLNDISNGVKSNYENNTYKILLKP